LGHIISQPSTSSDAEIRAGLPAVFPRLWRYGLSLTGKKDIAEDLAQRTCLRALEKADSFQVGTHLDLSLIHISEPTRPY